jgi:hypothetical protein
MHRNSRRIRDQIRRDQEASRAGDQLIDNQVVSWRVAIAGFECTDGVDLHQGEDEELGLTCRVIVPKRHNGEFWQLPTRKYFPLEIPGLFLKLGKLSQTEDAIIQFANEYGCLWGEYDGRIGESDGILCGEPCSKWFREIDELRRTVQLWELIRVNNTNAISNLISWSETKGWVYAEESQEKEPFASVLHSSARSAKECDSMGAARRFVQDWINFRISFHCGVRVHLSSSSGRYVYQIIPSRLIHCAWWQLARAFVGEIDYKFCKVCCQPFEVSKEGYQRNREFCSAACKQKDHREKVKQAKTMMLAGLSRSTISRELGITREILNNWLTKNK